MLDIARDARWGRIVEGAGEDPYLGSAMAAAQVRGFQGDDLSDPERILACAKHFAGYGAADGGRDYDPVYLSEAQLRNVYFPPFQAAVKAGVATFMSAYMDLNNVPATGNRWLLKDVLRGEWGFDGFVVSDAFAVLNLAIQGYARDKREAALRSLNAGLNIDMASSSYLDSLEALVNDGSISMEQIDEMVRPILAIKMRMELGSNEAIKQAIVGGLGVSVLSRHTLALDAPMGQLTILDVAGFPIERQWYVAYPAGKQLSIVARTFLEYLKQAPKLAGDIPCQHAERGACPLLPAKPARRKRVTV
jgi:beta-glucosidase